MPKDNVEAAIKRAAGKDVANYESHLRRLRAPRGRRAGRSATDNPTRTVATIRNIFNKHGGNLASTGSVAFMFRRMGVFRLDPAGIDQDDLELYLIDHGLDEMGESTGEKGEPQLVFRCLFADFGTLQKALEDRGITPSQPSTNTSAPRRPNSARPERPKPWSLSTSSSRTRTCRRCTTRWLLGRFSRATPGHLQRSVRRRMLSTQPNLPVTNGAPRIFANATNSASYADSRLVSITANTRSLGK